MATKVPRAGGPLSLGREDEGRFVSSEEFVGAFYSEPWRYERIGGRLVVLPPDDGEQVEATSPWLRALFLFRYGDCEVVELIVPGAWIRADEDTDRIADIGIYLADEGPVSKIPDRIPELVFDIVRPSDAPGGRDDLERRRDYHRLGIGEYVVVDRFQKTVTVFAHTSDGCEERVLTQAETYESPLLPGLAIPLAEVFRP